MTAAEGRRPYRFGSGLATETSVPLPLNLPVAFTKGSSLSAKDFPREGVSAPKIDAEEDRQRGNHWLSAGLRVCGTFKGNIRSPCDKHCSPFASRCLRCAFQPPWTRPPACQPQNLMMRKSPAPQRLACPRNPIGYARRLPPTPAPPKPTRPGRPSRPTRIGRPSRATYRGRRIQAMHLDRPRRPRVPMRSLPRPMRSSARCSCPPPRKTCCRSASSPI